MSTKTFDPIRRPGLAYQHAFDWLAVRLAKSSPAACLSSNTFAGTEILRRLPDLPFLEPLPKDLNAAAAALGCDLYTLGPKDGHLAAIALLEPTTDDMDDLSQITKALTPTGRIYLIAGGPLARFLAERRANHNSQSSYLNDRQAIHYLRQMGFRVTERVGWHGPKVIAWHTMSQIALSMGQRSRRDRYHFAMRRDFGQHGPSSNMAALTGLTVERAA